MQQDDVARLTSQLEKERQRGQQRDSDMQEKLMAAAQWKPQVVVLADGADECQASEYN